MRNIVDALLVFLIAMVCIINVDLYTRLKHCSDDEELMAYRVWQRFCNTIDPDTASLYCTNRSMLK